MVATSYVAFPSSSEPVQAGGLAASLLVAGLAAAVLVTGLSLVTGGARVDAAAASVSEMVGYYARLREADFEREIFPIAQTLGGRDLTGQPVVCGVVVSGIERGPGGQPMLAWQRAQGSCAGTRLRHPGGAAAIPAEVVAHGPSIAVELRTGWPRMGMRDGAGYAVSYAAPPSGHLSSVQTR